MKKSCVFQVLIHVSQFVYTPLPPPPVLSTPPSPSADLAAASCQNTAVAQQYNSQQYNI